MMQCINETALADLALTVVAKTVSTAGTRNTTEHIKSCNICSRRFATHLAIVRTIDGITRETTNNKAHRNCLDENAFAEFIDDVMSEDERDDAVYHLAQCQDCISRLSGLVTSLEEAQPSTWSYVFKRVKEGLEFLLHPEDGFTLVSHEPAVVLKANTHAPTIYSWTQETGECSVQFDLQELEHGTYSVQLTIFQQETLPDQSRLIVRVDGNIVQAQPLPDSGKIRLHGLSAQTYEIEIALLDNIIGPFELTIE